MPAPFRTALAGQLHHGLVVFVSSQHVCLEGFDRAKMEEISARMDSFDLFSDEQDDLATTIFGESIQLSIDGDGRVTLPQDLMRAAQIKEKATFVGLGRKFQIWSPELFERRRSLARGAVQDKKLTVPSVKREDG